MFRWKRVANKVFSAEPNEFDAFLGVTDGMEMPDDVGPGSGESNPEEGNEEIDFRMPIRGEEKEDSEEESSEEETTDEAETEEEEAVDQDEVDPLAELKAQNKKLMDIVTSLTGKKETTFEESQEEVISDPFDSELYTKFVEGMNWDEDEAKLFKTFFKEFADYNNAQISAKTTQSIPTIITETMTQKERVKAMRDNFYKENPALTDVQDYVQLVATQVNKNNPNLGVEEVLNKAADIVYKRLKITKDNEGEKAGKSKKPAFPKSPGARKPAPKQSEQDKEFNAMLALDDF